MKSHSWLQRKIKALFTAEDRPFLPKEIKERVQMDQDRNAPPLTSTALPEAAKIKKTPIRDRSLHYALNALIRDGSAQKVVFMTPRKPVIGYAKRTDVDTLVAVDGKFLMKDYHVKVSFGVCPRDPLGPYALYELGDRVLMAHMNRIQPSQVPQRRPKKCT
jgi:hypothetical protein